MTGPPAPASDNRDPQPRAEPSCSPRIAPAPPVSRGTGRVWLEWLFWGLLAVAPAVGHWTWRYLTRPQPPPVNSLGLEPLVQDLVNQLAGRISAQPRLIDGWVNLGSVLAGHGVYREAAECFAQAGRIQPEQPQWAYLEAYCREQWEPLERVIPLYRRSATAESLAARTPWLRLGEVLLETGRLDEARRCFQRVLRLDRHDPRALLGEARVAWEQGHAEQAREWLRQAQASDPRRPALAALRAQVETRLGRAAEAREQARQFRQLPAIPWPDPWLAPILQAPPGAARLRTQAEAQQAAGDLPGAEATLREAGRLHPHEAAIELELGANLVAQKKTGEGLLLLRQFAARHPGEPRVHALLGRALEDQQQDAAAAEEYRRFLEALPGHLPGRLDLARVLRRLNQTDEAERLLRDTVDLNPGSFEAHRDLGLLLLAQRRKTEALAELQFALQLRPDRAPLAELIARVEGTEDPAAIEPGNETDSAGPAGR